LWSLIFSRKRTWSLLEFFIHRTIVQREEDDQEQDEIKISSAIFKRIYSENTGASKDKLYTLESIEEALTILFPGTSIKSDDPDLDISYSMQQDLKERRKSIALKKSQNGEEFQPKLEAKPEVPEVKVPTPEELEAAIPSHAPPPPPGGIPPPPGGVGPPPPPGAPGANGKIYIR
jgi:hypothetical protein